jgi:heat shock protein HtpX
MPTLYTHADSNIRKTWILLTLFLVFVIAVGWLFSYLLGDNSILVIAVIISTVQTFASYWYSDKIVLAATGAHEIRKEDNPELYRIVENLTITAGLPLPKIFVVEESQPNAFATGRDEKHAVVAVTRGLLNKLERTELEGVIAHELSHIGNRDMLLDSALVVLVSIVALLSRLFLRFSYFRGSSRRSKGSRGGNAGAILLLLGLVGAILAPVVALLIRMAVSRKREFLADAEGALLTRYPEGLARALEKISGDPTPMKKLNESTAHLYIANPFREKNWLANLFSTHPPAEERVAALRGMEIT